MVGFDWVGLGSGSARCYRGMVALVGAATLFAAGAAFGQTAPIKVEAPQAPIPAEHFFQYPAVLEAKLSPSGRKLALTTSRGGKRVGLVVIELGDAPKATRAGAFSDADIVRFEWVGEDRLVFSVRDLEAGSGEDRRYAPGLYAANTDGSDLRQLVKRRGLPFVSKTRSTHGPYSLIGGVNFYLRHTVHIMGGMLKRLNRAN